MARGGDAFDAGGCCDGTTVVAAFLGAATTTAGDLAGVVTRTVGLAAAVETTVVAAFLGAATTTARDLAGIVTLIVDVVAAVMTDVAATVGC